MEGRKDKHGFKTAEYRKVKLALLSIPVCIYVWLFWELNKNPTQLPKMLTHLIIVFTAQCLSSWFHTTFQLLWTLILEPTLFSRVPLLTDYILRPLLWSYGFLRVQLFLWSSQQNRQRGLSRHLTLVKDAKDKIPLFSHPSTNRHAHTHIHTHIYIYIH